VDDSRRIKKKINVNPGTIDDGNVGLSARKTLVAASGSTSRLEAGVRVGTRAASRPGSSVGVARMDMGLLDQSLAARVEMKPMKTDPVMLTKEVVQMAGAGRILVAPMRQRWTLVHQRRGRRGEVSSAPHFFHTLQLTRRLPFHFFQTPSPLVLSGKQPLLSQCQMHAFPREHLCITHGSECGKLHKHSTSSECISWTASGQDGPYVHASCGTHKIWHCSEGTSFPIICVPFTFADM
jgi:hypothetical protein